jgi:hypothetical protein
MKPHNLWIGRQTRTQVDDSGEVEGRGMVKIPIGWRGRVDHITHFEDGEPMFAVVWEDDPNAPGGAGNMGSTVWSASELAREAEVIDAA